MKTKRILSLIFALCLLITLIPMKADAATVYLYRYQGEDRFSTSLAVANAMKEALGVEKFDAVIVASGANFADALSGSYLAAVKNAPILLAYKDKQNQMTAAYIHQNLKEGGTVYILGGTAAVPASMDKLLQGFNVRRLDGANRFETNLMILKEAGVQNQQEILVCTSTNFADSLSASATGLPILLVYNEKGKLTQDQEVFMASLVLNTFRIIGGESAVSKKMEEAVSHYGEVSRLSGANRFDTSVKVAETYFRQPSSAVLAYAGNFPDGLCGGPLAYALGGPLLLTSDKFASVTEGYTLNREITNGLVLGGSSLISDKSVIQIFAHITDVPDLPESDTPPTDPPSTDETAPDEPTTDTPSTDEVPDEKTVYERMIAMKEQYPEGMSWTNDNYYAWKGGYYSGGYGCAGFAFILSDAAFGDLPARQITENITIDTIRVGDILRVNGDSHSVVVMEIHEDYIVLAEGNYNYSIHWGRRMSAEEVAQADYVFTRYPAA